MISDEYKTTYSQSRLTRHQTYTARWLITCKFCPLSIYIMTLLQVNYYKSTVLTLVAVVWAVQDPAHCTQHVPICNINIDNKTCTAGLDTKDPLLITSSKQNFNHLYAIQIISFKTHDITLLQMECR